MSLYTVPHEILLLVYGQTRGNTSTAAVCLYDYQSSWSSQNPAEGGSSADDDNDDLGDSKNVRSWFFLSQDL